MARGTMNLRVSYYSCYNAASELEKMPLASLARSTMAPLVNDDSLQVAARYGVREVLAAGDRTDQHGPRASGRSR